MRVVQGVPTGEENVAYYANEILYAAMILRFIFITRALLARSSLNTFKAQRIARVHGISSNARLVFKANLDRSPGTTVIWMTLYSLLLLSFLLRVFQRPYFYQFVDEADSAEEDPSHFRLRFLYQNPIDSLFIIGITMTTVGYGTFTPFTYIGRLIAIIAAFWGAVLISFLIVVATSLSSLSHQQRQALNDIQLMESAATLVTGLCRFNYLSKQSQITYLKKQDHPKWKQILKRVERFKAARNQVKSALLGARRSVVQPLGQKSVRVSDSTYIDPTLSVNQDLGKLNAKLDKLVSITSLLATRLETIEKRLQEPSSQLL